MKIDFIGLGAARCGTSWVSNVLRTHPQICMSEPKEVRYFNRFEMPVGSKKGKSNPNHDKPVEWYFQRFNHATEGQKLGEYSPIYLSDPAAPTAIFNHFPETKLLVCLRNPIDRAFSLYKMHLGNGLIPNLSFDEALERESVYVDTGKYAEQLSRYQQHFSRDAIKVVIFEELIDAPEPIFKDIFNHLDVDSDVKLNFKNVNTNASAKRRSPWLHKTAFKTSQWLIDNGYSKTLTRLRDAGVHKLFNAVNAAPKKVSSIKMEDSTRSKLHELFQGDISNLESILDRKINRWR